MTTLKLLQLKFILVFIVISGWVWTYLSQQHSRQWQI